MLRRIKELEGTRDYGEGRIIKDEDVYKFILTHSTFWDRLDPRKLIEMWELAYGIFDGSLEMPKNKNWRFFGTGDRKPSW